MRKFIAPILMVVVIGVFSGSSAGAEEDANSRIGVITKLITKLNNNENVAFAKSILENEGLLFALVNNTEYFMQENESPDSAYIDFYLKPENQSVLLLLLQHPEQIGLKEGDKAAKKTDEQSPETKSEPLDIYHSAILIRYLTCLNYTDQKDTTIKFKGDGKISQIPPDVIAKLADFIANYKKTDIGKYTDTLVKNYNPYLPTDLADNKNPFGDDLDGKSLEDAIAKILLLSTPLLEKGLGNPEIPIKIVLTLLLNDINESLATLDPMLESFIVTNGKIEFKGNGTVTIKEAFQKIEIAFYEKKPRTLTEELDSIIKEHYAKTDTIYDKVPEFEKRIVDSFASANSAGPEDAKLLVAYLGVAEGFVRLQKLAAKVKADNGGQIKDATRLAYWRYFRNDDPNVAEVYTGQIGEGQFAIPFIKDALADLHISADLIIPVDNGLGKDKLPDKTGTANATDGTPGDDKTPQFFEMKVIGRYPELFSADCLRGSLIYEDNQVMDKYEAAGLGINVVNLNKTLGITTPDWIEDNLDLWVDGYYSLNREFLLSVEGDYVFENTREISLYGLYEHYFKRGLGVPDPDEGEAGIRWRIGDGSYLYSAIKNRGTDNTFIIGVSGFESNEILERVNKILGS